VITPRSKEQKMLDQLTLYQVNTIFGEVKELFATNTKAPVS